MYILNPKTPKDKQNNYVFWLKERIDDLSKKKAYIETEILELKEKLARNEDYIPDETDSPDKLS